MKIDRLLAEHQLLVTTAESCTGGLVASALVDICLLYTSDAADD